MSTHIINFPGADINTTQLTVGTGGLNVDNGTLIVNTQTSKVGIGSATPGYSLDVVGDVNYTGRILKNGVEATSSPWTVETSPDALSYTAGNVGIGAANPGATLQVTGNVHVSSNLNVNSNVFIAGGLVTNTGGVTKKTYSYTGALTNGQTIANSTIKITFSNHVFYAKVVAHLVEGTGEDLSTITFECAGGKWDGTSPSNNISMGPVGVIGASSANPWNSTISRTATTVAFAPTEDMAADGAYNVFIEYISQHGSGAVTNVIEGSTTEITFGY